MAGIGFHSYYLGRRDSMDKVNSHLPENRVEPNDKLTKCIFDLDEEAIALGKFSIRESKSNKDAKTVINFTSECLGKLEKLDSYDREVAMACFSLKESGNEYVTSEHLYRVMTGDTKARLYSAEEQRIKKSLERLISTSIRIELSALSKLGYKGENPELFGMVLPAQFVNNITVNGSNAHIVIKFLGESPLVTVAKMKNNQLLTYAIQFANVGGRNSPERIALKNYVLRRIEECRLHVQMSRTVTFSDVLKKNNLTDRNKGEKKRYRDFLIKCFEEWKRESVIVSYELIRSNDKAHGYRGISFRF